MNLKIIITTIFFFIQSLIAFSQPPGDTPATIPVFPDENGLPDISYSDCFELETEVLYNGDEVNVINSDCPNNTQINIKVKVKDSFWCKGCTPSLEVKANGKYIWGQYDVRNKQYSLSLTNLVDLQGLTRVVLDIKVDCPGWTEIRNIVASKLINLNVINENTTYLKREFIDYYGEEICIKQPNLPRLCCSPGSAFNYKVKNINITEIAGEIKLTGGFEVGTSFDVFSSKLKLETSLGISYKINTTIEDEFIFSLAGKEGACVYPGLVLQFNKYRVLEKKADCDNDNSNDEIVKDHGFELDFYNIIKKSCEQVKGSGCAPITPKFRTIIGSENLISSLDCLGSIYIDDLISNENFDELQIEWTDTRGNKYFSKDLIDVPVGIYKVTISNECCDTYTKEIEMCPNKVRVADWRYIESSDKWCSTFSCDEPVLRSNCSFSQCVKADRIEPQLDLGICKDKHYYQGEFLGVTNGSNLIVDVQFDNNIDQCIKKYICNDKVVETHYGFPDYGQWVFNSILNKCERTVSCFNELVPNILDVENAEVVFNNFSNLCEPLCDNIIQTPFLPINSGFWSWTENNGCQKEVLCTINGQPIMVEGTESFPYYSFNQVTNKCEALAFCNNFPTSNTLVEDPTNIGSWQLSEPSDPNNEFSRRCFKIVTCGNQIIQDFGLTTWNQTGIVCPTGRLFTASCDYEITNLTVCMDQPRPPSSPNFINDKFINDVVFPNPAINEIQLSKGNIESDIIRIYDTSGRIITNFSKKGNKIEILNLRSGNYIIQLMDVNNEILFKANFTKI